MGAYTGRKAVSFDILIKEATIISIVLRTKRLIYRP